MNVSLPSGWTANGGRVENNYYIAENENGVVVGYTVHGPGSYSVWAGESWSDKKILRSSCESEGEAKRDALTFMENAPDVHYNSDRGIGRLEDSEGNHVGGI